MRRAVRLSSHRYQYWSKRSILSSVNGGNNFLKSKALLLQEKRIGLVQDIRERKKRVKKRVEEVIERENVVTIPNLLCIGRILASPYIGYVILQSEFQLAMVLLIMAGLTDLADGWIARNWPNQASRIGSFLDPMADKTVDGTHTKDGTTGGEFLDLFYPETFWSRRSQPCLKATADGYSQDYPEIDVQRSCFVLHLNV
uniref:cardiolipin synthase (CMP-forming) n=2 Tax=Anopheles darlingi TaxID=43151 RepID=A0A2M4CID8_ANODA